MITARHDKDSKSSMSKRN